MTNKQNWLTCRGKLFHEIDYLIMAPQQIRRISAGYKERVKIIGNYVADHFFYFTLMPAVFPLTIPFLTPKCKVRVVPS